VDSRQPLSIAVALDGAGWHPAAWRAPSARPAELFGAPYWVDLVGEADRACLDFVSLEDSLAVQSSRRREADHRTDQVRGRLDAVLVAARTGPTTSGVGLVPTVTTTHTEPFHLSKAVATLDYVTGGRAGVQVRISPTALEAAQFGRRTVADPATEELRADQPSASVGDLFEEAADVVEVMRRLWDSWEDDAEIRDVESGRFVDRDRLHPIDFEGRWFSVRGPSITPRPPQGQPVVAALAHVPVAYRLAARAADLVFVTPDDEHEAARTVAEVRDHEQAEGRTFPRLRIFADLMVFCDAAPRVAAARRAAFDEIFGREFRSDAAIFTGTPNELAELVVAWSAAGIDGVRLRPAALPHDLLAITRELVPRLAGWGLFRRRYEESTLRARLGLARPENRYATRREAS
jgi:alkanesulfonate monooxygenase SsuD/methylene tetrahydromethanopterin reductase-like flavin-dependent oxidoreductase (luciferase family)